MDEKDERDKSHDKDVRGMRRIGGMRRMRRIMKANMRGM
jgi:hypothetical protein